MFNMYTKLTTALSAFALLISGGAWGQCADGEFAVDFALTAGSYASEITWQLNDEAGNNIFSGGAPDGATWCLAEGDYTFIGSDSYGDGWNGAVATFTINGITTSFTVEGASGSVVLSVSSSIQVAPTRLPPTTMLTPQKTTALAVSEVSCPSTFLIPSATDGAGRATLVV